MVDRLERGNIYFVYRPRVEHETVDSFDDVQRSYIVLSPHGQQVYRLIALGQKQLPEISHHGQQVWGFVDKVGRSAHEIEDTFERETYQTKTRGERVQPAMRPAGEGVYQILRHEDHTHLVYALELPEDPGEVQHTLHIAEEGSYILNVKNPEASSPRGTGLSGDRQADFPKRLQEKFAGRRFFNADPPDFLNYEGAEVLLISAAEDISEELGIKLNAQRETADRAEIFSDLRLEKSQHPVEPLLKGQWR